MTKQQRAAWIKQLRADCKELEICSYCYHEPVFKLKLAGKPTKIFSKCSRCLRRFAWFQAEYRDRIKISASVAGCRENRKLAVNTKQRKLQQQR